MVVSRRLRPGCRVRGAGWTLASGYCPFGQAENSKAGARILFGTAVRLIAFAHAGGPHFARLRRWPPLRQVTASRDWPVRVGTIRCRHDVAIRPRIPALRASFAARIRAAIDSPRAAGSGGAAASI